MTAHPRYYTNGNRRKRWICWPNPDVVCLQGGCLYCTPDQLSDPLADNAKKTLGELITYAKTKPYWPMEIDMDRNPI